MSISKFCHGLLVAASLITAAPRGATALEPGPLLSPKDALAKMTVPEGFAIDLLAAEPDLVQPIAFCWDERGRLWVVEGNTYPKRAGKPPTPRPDDDPHLDTLTETESAGLFEGKDRIVIFSDEDGDGSYETRKVFLENLNLVSGIEVGFGGVYLGAAPYFLYVPLDASGDKPSGPPRVLADGFGWQDTHETLNSFIWGPDGWLYGCHGVFTQSQVRVCTGPAGPRKRFPMNCAYWRWHPVRQEFELFAQGTSNPWGLDFNAKGQFFSEACVIPHFWHVIPGAYYLRQSNPLGHFNPYVYQNIDTIADHSHFAGKVHKQSAQESSDFGGGHAHCGLCIYDGLNFPAAYRGQPLIGNIHGKRINQERLLSEGSGYKASHAPDFLHSNDFNFTAVTLKQAPDGSLVFSDWYDKQKCHNTTSEIWDRSNGRLYRVKFSKAWTPWKPSPDLWSATSTLELQLQENGWLSRMARRHAAETAAKDHIAETLAERARNLIGSSLPAETRLRVMWWLHATNNPSNAAVWKERMHDSDPDVRQWAVQLLAERGTLDEQALADFQRLAVEDTSPVVRLALASALQRIPGPSRWEIATALFAHPEDAKDHNLPQMLWYGVESAVPEAPDRALQLAKNSRLELPAALIIRRLSEIRSEPANSLLLATVAEADSIKSAGFFLHPLEEAMNGRFDLTAPMEWKAAYDNLSRLIEGSPKAAESLKLLDARCRIGAAFNDPKAWKELAYIAQDRSVLLERRQRALQTLTTGRPSELASLLLKLLPDTDIRLDALRAGANAAIPENATADSLPAFFATVLEKYPTFNSNEKTAAVLAFSGRLATAKLLMDAVESKKVPYADLPMFAARQIAGLQSEALTDRVEKLWGKVRSSDSKEKAETAAKEHARLKAILTPNYLRSADLKNGRTLFQGICGACHQMYGEGGKIGPDLTGSNRADVDYILENVTNPSAIIGKDYELHVFTLNDGRIVTGMVRSEDDALFTVQSMGAEERIRKADIRSEEKPGISMMPEGLFAALSKEQLRDLVGYLASPQDVGSNNQNTKTAAYRIEGALEAEALKILSSPGSTSVQAMGGFPFGVWSGNAQIFWRGAKTGDILKLEVPVKVSGRLRVRAVFSRAPDYGIIKVRLDGHEMELGSIDLFGSKVTNTEALTLGFIETKAQGHAILEIELTGKNPLASDNKIGFDCLILEPVDGPAIVVSLPKPAAAADAIQPSLKATEPKFIPVKKKSIVMVAGKPSHGPGSHEHNAGVLLLAKCLRQGVDKQIEIKLHLSGGWPAQEELDRADTLVVYADGYSGHPILQENHLDQVGTMMKRGAGLVCIHWATEVPKEKGGAEFVQWLGGYCEPDWSVNPHWTADFSTLPKHPISNGVKPFSTLDEWYFHMRFIDGMRGVTPVLSAVAPASTMSRPDGLRSGNPAVRKSVADQLPQTVAWAVERPDGGRGFGFTGGHFHSGWANNDQRKLMLNAILWTAKGDLPDSGIDSSVTPEEMAANLDAKGK